MKVSLSKITVPVRNWEVALRKRGSDLASLHVKLEELRRLIELESEEDRYDIYKFFDEVCVQSYFEFNDNNNLYELIRSVGESNNGVKGWGGLNLDNMKHAIRWLDVFETLEPIKYPTPLFDQSKLSGWKSGDYSWESYYEQPTLDVIQQFMALPSLLKEINSLLSNLKRFMEQYRAWVKTNQAINNKMFTGEDADVEHDDVEVLYHATANMRHLLKNGFSTKRPEGHRGLGELGSLNHTVSLTYDKRIAQEIVRAFKEVWMIVHGKLKAHQILRWMETDGIDPNKKCPNRWPSGAKSTEDIVDLYNCWLWLNKSKIRQNPVFGDVKGLAKFLKKRRIQDIGIVKVTANMDGAKFEAAEREYRVDPKNIIKVEAAR